MSGRTGAPLVTGISPKEGPPGTRVTIRGENLGIDAKDLIGLKICGVDCLLSCEWKSPSKILARTGQAKGKGDVVVVTRSGGVGSCTVGFRGYYIQIGPLQDSAVWVDESQTITPSFSSRNRTSSPILTQEQDDPLGISDETNEAKFPEDELLELFPEGTGNTSLENFVPAWYLLENHHGTSFDDLKAGLAFLKRKSTQSKEGPLAFVKTNVTTFLDCQHTLEALNDKMTVDKVNNKGVELTEALEKILNDGNKCSDDLFKEVLGRKDRADATRNALSVLQRFKFLFNLPHSIDRNIKKGDYDLVITDYARARSLFGETEVQVFRKVYRDVENRIEAFREMIHKKLLELPTPLEEQKKYIRFLHHLNYPGDPGWSCLTNQQNWLIQLLHQCKQEHLSKENEATTGDKDPSNGSPTSSGSGDAPNATREQEFKSASRPPQKVLFVENVTKIMTDTFPDLWRLGQAYFSGKLLKDAGGKPTKMDTNKYSLFKNMVSEVIILFSNLLRAAFLSVSLENVPTGEREQYGVWCDNKKTASAWLPHCVRHVRICVAALGNLDLPGESIDVLQDLAFDMRTICMTILLKQAIQDTKNLHHRETWVVEADDEMGGRTQLPLLFENIVNETIQHLNEVMTVRPGENKLFSLNEAKKEAFELCKQLLTSFATCLEHLAIIGNIEREVKDRRSAIKPDMFSAAVGDTMPALGNGLLTKDKRTLIMLSNCNHTIAYVIPRLVENLDKHGYPDMDKVFETVLYTYSGLDKELFARYIEEKTDPIVGQLEQNMYRGMFDWNNCLKVTGVRSYIKVALMEMTSVHAEVYEISCSFVSRVMHKVVEAVCDEVSRLIQCAPAFSRHGALQARLDLKALQEAVTQHQTEVSLESLKEALEFLPALASEDEQLMEELFTRFKTRMRFQLLCFHDDNHKFDHQDNSVEL